MDREKLGLMHIYCGNGKGKTTAALGLALRASGSGLKVVFAQFMKARDTGELNALPRLLNVTVMRAKPISKFSFQMDEKEKEEVRQSHAAFILEIKKVMEGADLLVLDEAVGAVARGLLDEDLLLELLDTRPPHLEVVLTGRDPSEELLRRADYVSEMVKRKHPFDRGIPAREGIEK